MIAGDNEASTVDNGMSEAGFNWELDGRLTILDNGARLPSLPDFSQLMTLDAFAVVAFDPASRLQDKPELKEIEELQVFPHALLGDGQPATLYACLEPSLSGTLEPLEADWLPEKKRKGSRVLARLPVSTVMLDSIEGLDSVDVLILDDLNDSVAVLENGTQALQDTLLIQVRIPFRPTHDRQPDIAQVSHWMARHGFRFYRFHNTAHHSHMPSDAELEKHQASEMISADAIFIINDQRLESLPTERQNKMAFLLHTLYQIHDMTYEILAKISPDNAKRYLVEQGYLWWVDENETEFYLTEQYSPEIWA